MAENITPAAVTEGVRQALSQVLCMHGEVKERDQVYKAITDGAQQAVADILCFGMSGVEARDYLYQLITAGISEWCNNNCALISAAIAKRNIS